MTTNYSNSKQFAIRHSDFFRLPIVQKWLKKRSDILSGSSFTASFGSLVSRMYLEYEFNCEHAQTYQMYSGFTTTEKQLCKLKLLFGDLIEIVSDEDAG